MLWDGAYSDWFLISAGVRQGGVLPPDFYGIYVDELIYILNLAVLVASMEASLPPR